MPLPPNTTLALHGVSKPGEPLYSKPKQAIIVRLTSETLDALDSVVSGQNTLEFDFTKEWGIHIGDGFYPMTRREDNSRHDLLLRASTINKPNAPLKFHSSVSGRVTVEQELRRDVTDRVRQRTREEADKRSERHTIMLDTPPTLPGPQKKKTALPSSKKERKPSDAPKAHSSQSASAAREAPSKGVPLSARLVHFLANGEKSVEEIAKALGGTRADVDSMLRKVAEPSPTQSKSKTLGAHVSWRLNNEGWLLVRPYEWPSLSENARTSMARSGRRACQALKLPESDPAWSHFVPRPPKGIIEDIKSANADRRPQPRSSGEPNSLLKGKKRESPSQPPNQDLMKKTPGSGFRASASSSTQISSHVPSIHSTTPSHSSTPVPSAKTRQIPSAQHPVVNASIAPTLKRKRGNIESETSDSLVKEEEKEELGNSVPLRAGSKSRGRRKSPIYTSSSEDESPPAVKARVEHSRQSPSMKPRTASRPSNARLSPQGRYNEVYLQYITVYQKLAAQVQRNQHLLDTIANTGDDAQCHDEVIIVKDELSQLMQQFRALKAELQEMAENVDTGVS